MSGAPRFVMLAVVAIQCLYPLSYRRLQNGDVLILSFLFRLLTEIML